MNKEQKLELVNFLKTPKFQEVTTKLNNQYDADMAYFQAKYEGEDNYIPSDLSRSEINMYIDKLNFFKQVISDVEKISDCEWANLIIEILEREMESIQSQIYNTTTNSMGMSKDTAMYTDDDLRKYLMLHRKDFHILIVWLMTPVDEYGNWPDKYEIYEKPEEYFEIEA